MLSEFIAQAQKEMDFEVILFGGALKVRGRVLSPSEVDRASVASAKLLQSMHSRQHTQTADLQKKLKENDPSAIELALDQLNKINPKQMEDLTKHQDNLIRNSLKKASRDGKIWEDLEIVLFEHQEDPQSNKLWVGRISKEDRQLLLSKMMTGHREAVERLSTFR